MDAFDMSTPQPQYANKDIDVVIEAIVTSKAQHTLSEANQVLQTLPKYKSYEYYNRGDEQLSFGFSPICSNQISKLTFVLAPTNHHSNHRRVSIPFHRPVALWSASKEPNVPIDVIDSIDDRARVLEIITNHEKRVEDYKVNRHNYDATVTSLLDRCTTLKQFLSAWPAGESFVPQDKINELHTKVTRIQKAQQIKEDINFDDTAVNKVVLTAKLMGN